MGQLELSLNIWERLMQLEVFSLFYFVRLLSYFFLCDNMLWVNKFAFLVNKFALVLLTDFEHVTVHLGRGVELYMTVPTSKCLCAMNCSVLASVVLSSNIYCCYMFSWSNNMFWVVLCQTQLLWTSLIIRTVKNFASFIPCIYFAMTA